MRRLAALSIPGLASALRNSAAVFSSGLAVRAVGFLAFLLLSRGLAPEHFGTFALVLTTVELVRQLVELGLNTATVRRLATQPRDAWSRTIGAGLVLRLAAAALGYILIVAASFHPLLRERAPLFWLGGVSLLTGAVTNSLIAPFQASLAMGRLVPVQLTTVVLYVGLVSYGLSHGWGVVGFLGAFLLHEAYMLAGVAVLFGRRYRADRGVGGAELKSLIRDAAGLGILGVIVLLYFRLDVFMLEAMRGSADVGKYVLAFRISEALLLGAGAVSASGFPRIAELATNGSKVDLERSFSVVYRAAVSVGALGAAALAFAAPVVLPRLVPAYPDAGVLAAALGWSVVFMFANIQTADLLVAIGRVRVVTIVACANLCLNFLGNLLLIPRFGALGAVIATIVTEGINTMVQGVYIHRRVGIPVPAFVWAPAMALTAVPFGGWLFGPVGLSVTLVGLLVLLPLGWGGGPFRVPAAIRALREDQKLVVHQEGP